ncbi:MAG TPA: TfuA-like protein [Kofleriaceae bacterium]|nr:TfuA-like protein [Kofleriaceae bacterium]
MADPAVIFVGPSLRPPRPAAPPGARYAPPAARGDVLAAAERGARVIGLIDGVFHQDLAVTPREIRAAAATGAHLFGGASMGALRACDCPGAITGVGEIYARLAAGELTDDDEVAVAFDPVSHELAAYPLVQIREAARAAAAAHPGAGTGTAAGEALRQFVEAARGLPFHDRTRDQLRRAAAPVEAAGIPWPDLAGWLDAPSSDLKRRDALAVVAAVAAALADDRR